MTRISRIKNLEVPVFIRKIRVIHGQKISSSRNETAFVWSAVSNRRSLCFHMAEYRITTPTATLKAPAATKCDDLSNESILNPCRGQVK